MADNQLPSDIDLKVPARGPAGKDGKTPQRGIDYWTYWDQQTILRQTKEYVDDAILNGKWWLDVGKRKTDTANAGGSKG